MFVLKTKYDHFTHHTSDIQTLSEIVLGLTNDETETKRITGIAEYMKIGDAFAGNGILLVNEKDEVVNAY